MTGTKQRLLTNKITKSSWMKISKEGLNCLLNENYVLHELWMHSKDFSSTQNITQKSTLPYSPLTSQWMTWEWYWGTTQPVPKIVMKTDSHIQN